MGGFEDIGGQAQVEARGFVADDDTSPTRITTNPHLVLTAESVIPAGRMGYVMAQVALADMRAALVQDYDNRHISAARKSLEKIAQADREGQFEPPLSPELSALLQEVDSSLGTSDFCRTVYHGYEQRNEADPNKLYAAALLVGAIIDHGMQVGSTNEG